MIIDKLENASEYYSLGKDIERGLKYLQNTDLKSMPCQKHVIDGDVLWANIQQMPTKEPETTPWEIHKTYTDIQYVITGTERMDWANVEYFEGENDYDKQNDYQFGLVKPGGTQGSLIVNEGYFVIFTPFDAHKPALKVDKVQDIKKVIVKVKN